MAKILIVDDSETFRLQVRKALESAGHEVIEAENGFHGVAMVEANKDVQLLICDMHMPQLDGLGMCQTIHGMRDFQMVPVFMLTTESSLELKQRGKQVGVTAWITKPYSPEKLLAAVARVLKI